jgi:hypothetical protein
MNGKVLAGALAASVCVMCVGTAGAVTQIQIGLNNAPGMAGITTVATGAASAGVSWLGSFEGFSFNVVSGSDTNPIDFGTTSINATPPSSPPAGPIYVYVTETGITNSLANLSFVSHLTENELSPGWAVAEATFEDNGNVAYGVAPDSPTATLLFSQSSNADFDVSSTKTIPVGSTFSLTELYVIQAAGAGGALSTEHIGTVPEPATWAMMALGFAGLAFAGSRKARSAVSIA